jgi:hypothetical protein
MIQEREIFIALMSIQNFEENCCTKKENENLLVNIVCGPMIPKGQG